MSYNNQKSNLIFHVTVALACFILILITCIMEDRYYYLHYTNTRGLKIKKFIQGHTNQQGYDRWPWDHVSLNSYLVHYSYEFYICMKGITMYSFAQIWNCIPSWQVPPIPTCCLIKSTTDTSFQFVLRSVHASIISALGNISIVSQFVFLLPGLTGPFELCLKLIFSKHTLEPRALNPAMDQHCL